MTELRTARRIPANLPFVLRPGPLGRALTITVGLVPTGIIVLTGVLVAGDVGIRPVAIAYLGTMFVVMSIGGLAWVRYASRPVLGADADAVWILVRRWPALAVRVPWSEVARVGQRPNRIRSVSSRNLFLRVELKNPEPLRGLGRWAELQMAWHRFRYGDSLMVRVPFGMTSNGVQAALSRLGETRSAAPNQPTGPYQLAGRVPEGLPLSLPRDPRQTVIVTCVVGFAGIATAVVGLLVGTAGQPWPIRLISGGVILVVIASVLGLTLRSWLLPGPALAADSAGVWARYKLVAPGSDAVFLPWHTVDDVQVRRHGKTLTVTVRPKGPWEPTRPEVVTADDRLLGQLFRTGITVAINPGYRDAADLAGILTALAADRCRVTQ